MRKQTRPSPIAAWCMGFRASFSLIIGYAPIAMSFGVVAVQSGLSLWQAVLLSVLIFSGASQFVMVSMLAAGSGAWPVVSAVLMMNLRHLFYGPALAPRLTHPARRMTPLLAFGLTDEVFATAMAHGARQPIDPPWLLGLANGAYASWVIGTGIGAWFGASWRPDSGIVTEALAFMLPALFIALLSQALRRRLWPVAAASAGVAVIGTIWLPSHVALLIAMVAGGMAGALIPPGPKS